MFSGGDDTLVNGSQQRSSARPIRPRAVCISPHSARQADDGAAVPDVERPRRRCHGVYPGSHHRDRRGLCPVAGGRAVLPVHASEPAPPTSRRFGGQTAESSWAHPTTRRSWSPPRGPRLFLDSVRALDPHCPCCRSRSTRLGTCWDSPTPPAVLRRCIRTHHDRNRCGNHPAINGRYGWLPQTPLDDRASTDGTVDGYRTVASLGGNDTQLYMA